MAKSTYFRIKKAYLFASVALIAALFLCVALGICIAAPTEAYADEASLYDFVIDTGDYGAGTWHNAANDTFPAFTLTYTSNVLSPDSAAFWYALSDGTKGKNVPAADSADWIALPGDYNTTTGIMAINLASIARMNYDDSGNFDKYMYFRGGSASGDEYYVNPDATRRVKICGILAASYEIDSVEATYIKDGVQTTYDLTSQEDIWAASPVTIRVTNGGGERNNAVFYYQLEGQAPQPFITKEREAGSPRYYGEIEIPGASSTLKSYSGKITLFSTNLAGDEEYEYKSELRIAFDTETPDFGVTATIPKGSATEAYANNTWTDRVVTYEISLTATISSGVTYYYSHSNSSGDWILLSGTYLTIDSVGTTDVYFRAVSGSGIERVSQRFISKIDPVAPKVSIAATDAIGTVIRSEGSAPSQFYRVGYASDLVRFNVSNANAEVQQSGNYATYYYSTDGEHYSELTSTNDNYVVTVSNTPGSRVLHSTYYFRIMAESGLVDTTEFRVTVLDSSFATDMSVSETHPNGDGWLRDPVKVRFTMPKILGVADEYEIRGYVTGNSGEEAVIPYVEVTAPVGSVCYEVTIERVLNNQSLSFNVYDKARNKVDRLMGENKTPVTDESGSPVLLRTDLLKLDLTTPSAEIRATINGTDIVLEDGDWSAGEVRITITPASLVSGIKCYPMKGLNQTNTPMEPNGSGIFTMMINASGVYAFRLVSGAGISQDISIAVNIDNSDIAWTTGVKAYTEDKDGTKIDDIDPAIDLTDGSLLIANNVRLVFGTTHAGHFDIYYATFTGATPQIDESAYVLYVPEAGETPDSFLLAMPETGVGVGSLKYSFILKSKAVNSAGEVKQLLPTYVHIKYDIREFSISVETNAELTDAWYGGPDRPIDFTIRPNSDGEVAVDATLYRYQYRLGRTGEWINITDVDAMGARLLFGGVKNYVNDEERNSDNEEYDYMSYNGYIEFRALNQAGHSSIVTGELLIKVDVSTPNPLYAISAQTGETQYVTSNSKSRYVVYSNSPVYYSIPQAVGVFSQKAPITYYYHIYRDGDRENINEIAWSTLKEHDIVLESNAEYWMYAENSVGSVSAIYKVHVQVETEAPTAMIVSGGTAGAQSNVLEFNWSKEAVIQIRVKSTTAVYFWYSFNYQVNGSETEWVLINSVPVGFSGGASGTIDKNIIFASTKGPEDDEFTIPGNRNNTVNFKVTNLSGSECLLDKAVIVRIDMATPVFNLTFSTPTREDIAEAELDNWFYEAITTKISPAGGPNQNPGGVVYTYRIGDTGTYENLRTNLFSTDDLIGFAGNGEVKVWVRAVSNANKQEYTHAITFRIDKLMPEFELSGSAKKDGVVLGRLSSGTWTNADEVNISLTPSVSNKSGVTYTYHFSTDTNQETVWLENHTVTVNNIMDLYVTATSGAGLVVSKKFEVKIDNHPPIIHAGNIVNSDDPKNPNRYYIDQVITYTEDNLKSAMYNNFPLSNGQIIATNTVDNSNGGYVHIVVEDLAGNKAELTFYMTIFELTVNNIELSDQHRNMLDDLSVSYENAKENLTSSRQQYFETLIGRLNDRLSMLEKQVESYQGYLSRINSQASFELQSDYEEMYTYINYFITEDDLIRYPEWQQNKIKEGIYESYYKKLESEFYKLDALMKRVREVQNAVIALPATNVVTRDDYKSVVDVYNMYDRLSRDQKTVFKPNLYNKIMELKRVCEVYLLQDEATGVSIDGDKLVGETTGVMLEVVSYPTESETFVQAQKTLYNMYDSSTPRKILSINHLSFSGFGSQYDTGEIVVTLPIPEDYRNYVYFAVYRLSSDGTISPVKDIMRSPDGGSVYFNYNKLDTFILATSANVGEREDPAKVYGSIAGIEIDAILLTYITYVVIGMFAIFVVIILLVALRQRKFLRSYNRDHKKALQRRGITRIPKGNAPPPSNPARPEERVSHEHNVYYKK